MAAVQAGAQDYLTKRSLDGQVLWRTVRYAMERKRAEVVARHNAMHDVLTGLPNRVLFLERLTEAMSQPGREQGHVAVMFIDIDRFKWINDSLGHAAGDALLVAVARRLDSALRPRDVAARLGGDEFVVLCEHMPSEFAALERAERIQAALSVPFDIGDTEVWISTSIGIALTTDLDGHPKDLIRDADRAMYRAKARGKSRCELYDVDMRDRAESRWRMANDLHRALLAGEFVVHYQPVVDLVTGASVGAEALVRWQHPDGRLVPPGEFIVLAEETGLVVPIGDLVLDTACRQLKVWQAGRRADATLVVTVNVSARQIEDPAFPGRVRDALERSGADPSGLGLEITETALIRDEEGSLTRLLELEALGVKLYMDDFGTGYSSLTYLKKFPFHAIKIDTEFTHGLGVDEQDTAIVEAVIRLAQSLRLEVIAEGVETAQQAELLQALGCRFAQGYHFARPSADGRLDGPERSKIT
jgi:diguanylate cyclase (GGDEF)-like protein